MKRLKRYFSLLLTVCLLCTIAPIATAANSGNERLYIPIVEQVLLKESNRNYENWTRVGLNNGILYDLDDDGVDELILLHTSDRTDNSNDPVYYDGFYAVFDLYDIENGKLVTRFKNRMFGWHVDGVGYNLSLARYQRNQTYICCMLKLQNGTDNWMTERDFSWTFYHYDGSTLTKGVEMKDHQVGRCVGSDFVVDSHTYSMVSSYGLDSQNCSELDFYYMQNRFAEIDVNKLTRSELLSKLNSIPVASSSITVKVNGTPVRWTDAKPFIDSNDRTMVPLRAVAEAMGLSVDWDSANRTAVFTNGRKTVRFPIDSKTAYTTEGSIKMDTAAVIVNDRTYAPIRYLAEYFSWTVGWDGTTRTVSLIDSPQSINGKPRFYKDVISILGFSDDSQTPEVNVQPDQILVNWEGVQSFQLPNIIVIEGDDGWRRAVGIDISNHSGFRVTWNGYQVRVQPTTQLKQGFYEIIFIVDNTKEVSIRFCYGISGNFYAFADNYREGFENFAIGPFFQYGSMISTDGKTFFLGDYTACSYPLSGRHLDFSNLIIGEFYLGVNQYNDPIPVRNIGQAASVQLEYGCVIDSNHPYAARYSREVYHAFYIKCNDKYLSIDQNGRIYFSSEKTTNGIWGQVY